MIRTTDLNYAAILITLGLARLTKTLAPEPPERMITFELTVSAENLERAQALEQGYNELSIEAFIDQSGEHGGNVYITLGQYLDGIQRVRRAMRGVQAVRR